MPRHFLLLFAGVLVLVSPGVSRAAELREVANCDRYHNCSTSLQYIADPGERNELRITASGSTVEFSDPGASIRLSTPLCQGFGSARARCAHGLHPVFGVRVLAGDQPDRVDASALSSVAVTLIGGSGDDALIGGRSNDRFDGGLGADEIHGGAGQGDLVTFQEDLRGRVHADLTAGVATLAGERDRLDGIEDLRGGAGNDVLIGDLEANELTGGGGRDVVRGRDGDDVLHGPGRLHGGRGDDVLRLTSGRGQADCGAGRDTVRPNGPRSVLDENCELVSLFPFEIELALGNRAPERDHVTLNHSNALRGDVVEARMTTIGGRQLGRTNHRRPCQSSEPCRRIRLRFSPAGAHLVRRAKPLTVILGVRMRRAKPYRLDFRHAVRVRLHRR